MIQLAKLKEEVEREEALWLANFVALGGLWVLALALVVSMAWTTPPPLLSVAQEPREKVRDYAAIGFGPLALNGIRHEGPVPLLASQLRVQGKNTRPDKQGSDLLIALKGERAERAVKLGEVVSLQQGPEGLFQFATAPTPLTICLSHFEGDQIVIEVQSEDIQGRFTLPAFDQRDASLDELPYVQLLKEATSLGRDLFLQRFGGAEYSFLAQEQKIAIGSEILFVKSGDYLSFVNGRWEKATGEGPLAEVVSASMQGIDIKVWDESGFRLSHVHLPAAMPLKFFLKVEEILGAFKKRSDTEITCMLGKRRAILKPGDWWLKMEKGWKKLQTSHDIDAFIEHRLQGELLVIDSVTVSKDKASLKGLAFDPTRTEMQPFAVTLNVEKRESAPPAGAPLSKKARGKKVHGEQECE